MNFEEIILKIDPKKDYKVVDVAKMTGLSYSCILQHVKRETFPSRRVFNRIYVKGIDLRNYLTGEKN